MKTDLQVLELDICDAIDCVDNMEDIIMIGEWLGRLKTIAAEAKKARDARFIELLNESDSGNFTFGDTRYYVGTKKKIKPLGNWQIMEALLEQTGGDAKQMAGCLASDAWKQGGIKKLVGDDKHKELFETIEELEVKTGKPKKELKQVPTKLIK